VYGSSDAELDLTLGQVIEYFAGVGQRAREAVEFGDNQRVSSAAGGERLAQPGTFSVGSGQAAT